MHPAIHEALNEAQSLLWDIREMDDMEMDTTGLMAEYDGLMAYVEMAEDMEGVQI